jgi:hypothetical protein
LEALAALAMTYLWLRKSKCGDITADFFRSVKISHT